MKVRFVGLDVHKRVVEVCVIDGAGEIVFRMRFGLTRESLERFAKTKLQRTDRVVLEATTNTWAVVKILKPYVQEVVVSNPLKTRVIAEAKVKTDKVDAYILAQLLRCDFLPRVWEPDEKTQELRRLASRRAGLVHNRIQVKHRVQSTLAQRLLSSPTEDLFGPTGMAWLRNVTIDAEGRETIESNLRLLEAVEREIAEVDQVLCRKGFDDERVKLLMTLPGLDVVVAIGLLAAWGDSGRFKDAHHAASYLGLAPSTHQSADYCYHGPITKAGNGYARSMLIQAAHTIGGNQGPLGAFYRRLVRKKNHNVAVTAVARKLAVIAWQMLRTNEPYRYAQPRNTEAKLRRLRVQATGKRRTRGPKPGVQGVPKLGRGIKTYTIKPLAQVYEEEGLPNLKAPPPGEARAITMLGVKGYVESLNHAKVVARRPKPSSRS